MLYLLDTYLNNMSILCVEFIPTTFNILEMNQIANSNIGISGVVNHIPRYTEYSRGDLEARSDPFVNISSPYNFI